MWYYIIRFALHKRLQTDASNNHKLFIFFPGEDNQSGGRKKTDSH
jgi:hypothetical protein